jgi:hypothetical protein
MIESAAVKNRPHEPTFAGRGLKLSQSRPILLLV